MSLHPIAEGASGPLASSAVSASAVGSAQCGRIVLVEDHPMFAAGLQALFNGVDDLEVVGHARNGEAALSLVRQYQPDIVMLDITLGTENGLDLIPRIRRICPKAHIVVLTGHEESDYLMTALRQGAHAYIQKDMPGASILTAVRQTLNGQRVVAQPAAMTAALTELSELLRARAREQSLLTPRELEILRLAAAGHKNKDIGARLFLSEVSIKRKMLDIYRKLNVSGKPAAVAEAMRLGLI